ncbi:deoxynucleoside kinase [Mesorhizobium sp. SP-1A]|uniref:deoxynucleoside kinase n=1 Tax=Mesorhizobium sp. SP-1A TaxID=3077840 RepID=UPI0028F70955|nr:deoxynucleoside kinase [Mesorhizobium sp. SP-1A]
MRIEIIAPLAAGKSTLVQHLSGHGFELVTEDLSTNPFLELRKIDPETYTLPCQEKFIADKISSLGAAIENSQQDIIADFSVWTERAYARHLIPTYASELSQMSRQVDDFYEKYGLPDLLVCMAISTGEQIERIKQRGRSFEQVHSYDYLHRLNEQIELEASLAVLTGVKALVLDAGKLGSDAMAAALLDEVSRMRPQVIAA